MRPKIRDRDSRCLFTFEGKKKEGREGGYTRHRMEFIGLKRSELHPAETIHRFTMIRFARSGFIASDPTNNSDGFAAIESTRTLFKEPPGKKKRLSIGYERMPWTSPIRSWDIQHSSTSSARSPTRV